MCAETIRLNDLGNVALFNVALGERPGSALLATSSAGHVPLGGGSRIVDAGKVDGWGEVEEVELLTLDDVIGEDRDVSAIHLDIENREQQALAGGMCTIQRCRPQLVLETCHAKVGLLRISVVLVTG